MGHILLLGYLASALFAQDACSSRQVAFLEIPIRNETLKDGQVEVVCFVRSTDLSETGVSEEELRRYVVAYEEATTKALAAVIADMFFGDPDDKPQRDKTESLPPEQTAYPGIEKLEPLLVRGVFVEVRLTRPEEPLTIVRGLISFRKGKLWGHPQDGGTTPERPTEQIGNSKDTLTN